MDHISIIKTDIINQIETLLRFGKD